MCINDAYWGTKIPGYCDIQSDGPEYADIDLVTGEIELSGVKYYILEDWPSDAFDSECFIPISDIDETEFERESIGQLTA